LQKLEKDLSENYSNIFSKKVDEPLFQLDILVKVHIFEISVKSL